MKRLQEIGAQRVALQLEAERERGALRQQASSATLGLGTGLLGYLAMRRWGPLIVSGTSFLLAASAAWRLARKMRQPEKPLRP